MSIPPTPQSLYSALSTFFSLNADSILELEVLPSSYSIPQSDSPASILQDGSSLAIRKKDLAQAFLIARQILLPNTAAQPSSAAATVAAPPLAHPPEAVYDATRIALFFDPEYLTAANTRKRYILQHISASPSPSPTSPEAEKKNQSLLKHELLFIASLQTSPLPRHTKSPTLWHHRYWVLSTFRAHLPLAEEWLGRELEIVLATGERHFANYYAFAYARRLVALSQDGGEEKGEGMNWRGLIERMRGWCLAHPRDVSGWGFLCFLLQREGTDVAVSEVVGVVRESAEKFAWKGKGVSWFLKAAGQVKEDSNRESATVENDNDREQ